VTKLVKGFFLALTLSIASFAGAQDIKVQIDGNAVLFPNAQPQKIHGRVLVPMRRIFEQLGATVSWDRATQAVTAEKDGKTIDLTIGRHIATVNGNEIRLDVPAMIVDGSTMVPIRFVSEALGAQVGWLEAERLVSIDMGPTGRPLKISDVDVARRRDVAVAEPAGTVVARRDEVIPIVLDGEISNFHSSKGDTFVGTVRMEGKDSYGRIPRGTQVFGHVAAVVARREAMPPVLDLAFDKLVFPDGQTIRIYGTLISLDQQHVTTAEDGTLEILNKNNHMAERMVYVGYGDGAGRFVPIPEKAELNGHDHMNVMTYLVEHVRASERTMSDIKLDKGTQMGIRLTSRVVAN